MIHESIDKVDSKSLLQGKPVYTDDLANFKNILCVKILRSPYAHAKIIDIDTSRAEKLKGIERVFTYKDVPQIRYTISGESYPEPSPYDRLILDQHLRYCGDEVAIVAGETDKIVEKALDLIKVKYEVLEPLLDPEKSDGSEIIVHPEDGIIMPDDMGLDTKRNVLSTHKVEKGNIEKSFEECDAIIENQYTTQAQEHCMMETHRAFSYLDDQQRLVVVSSTQSAFHTRRQIAKALGMSIAKVRVIKPRIGGGFGGKNIALVEPYVGFVTMKTGRPAKMVFTRKETFSASNTRHSMRFKVKLGATKEGILKAIRIDVLNNTGAYGEDGPAVTMVSSGNMLPLYNKTESILYIGKTVYTNIVPGGALRGYGATQSTFAMESAVYELASKLKMDPIEFRLKNIVSVGDRGGILYNEIRSCNLDKCINKGKEIIGWNEKYPFRNISDTKIRAVGMSIAAHGTGVGTIGLATITMRLEEDGTYIILSGSSDLGTGSDTVLTQIAAKTLNTAADKINMKSGDTDFPYDTGAFASCTTYVTGNAVIKTAEVLKKKILEAAAKELNKDIEEIQLLEDRVVDIKDESNCVLLSTLGIKSTFGSDKTITATETFNCTVSPPPFVAGFAEIDIDKETGKVDIVQYVAVIDCGTTINPKLAKVQAEGGIAQGIGLALYEDVRRTKEGRLITDNFMQYKIPCRKDLKNTRIFFEESYEPTGPYGAKSIGEVVVHTPSPAIANAIFNGTGVIMKTLPMTPDKVYKAIKEKNKNSND